MASPTRKKRWLIVLGLLGLVGAVVAAVAVPPTGWTSNDVTTGQHQGYPDLQSIRYDVDKRAATLLAAGAAQRIPGWTVKRTLPDEGIMEAEVAVPAFARVFTDDVTVTVTEENNASVVRIRSRSRVGRGDMGENARHIRALQAAMNAKLPRL